MSRNASAPWSPVCLCDDIISKVYGFKSASTTRCCLVDSKSTIFLYYS